MSLSREASPNPQSHKTLAGGVGTHPPPLRTPPVTDGTWPGSPPARSHSCPPRSLARRARSAYLCPQQIEEPLVRAVGYQESLPIEAEAALVDITLPKPVAEGRDLLVQVQAISVNPVDTKVRRRAKPEPGAWTVLGYDAAGTVIATGPDSTLFAPGDTIFYAGDMTR